MAAQTHGAVDSLLGLLSSAIKDEARLLGGVHGDVQFIRDEMDSMNGFLLHLTKTEGEHDDQLRAWMKQVRDIAYIAEDCIELYVRDLAPPDDGFLAFLRHLPVYLWTAPARHRLATKIRELKVRVRDVGERRLRYGINVPGTEMKRVVKPPAAQDESDKAKEAFLQALEDDLVVAMPSGHVQLASEEAAGTISMRKQMKAADYRPSFSKAIALLPFPDNVHCKQAVAVRGILEKCYPSDANFSCTKMFLCALHLYPYTTIMLMQELESLKHKLDDQVVEPKELVRTFCYSMLSTQQKSCLQYLTAFLEEKSISRTSLVRRWVAEGLVGKEQERTPEEVGERCFGELVFRGFVVPAIISHSGTVKSCFIDDSIKEFILRVAKSENFVSELPSHLERQLEIRRIVLRPRPRPQRREGDISHLCCCCRGGTSCSGSDDPVPVARESTDQTSEFRDPMDELVHFLKSLPEVYRLNVLDLGGCQGLKRPRYLKSICKVVSLKYLSLRKTDVSRLPARHIQALRLLETLDIRETSIPAGDTRHMFLPKLKHLLAGSYTGGRDDTARTWAEESLCTVQVPRRIGTMRHMETLSDVQVSDKGTELDAVAKLPQLRKLGVVVHANEDTTRYLPRVINGLTALRSLSIWVSNGGTTLKISSTEREGEGAASFSASRLILENLYIKGKCILPSWIKDVKTLANITLCGTEMQGQGDLIVLGDAHGLRCLTLLNGSCAEHLLNFMDGQFKALKVLVVEDEKITSIAFADGAAPMLQKIHWTFHEMDKEKEEPLSGIPHLRELKEIELRGDDDEFDPRHLKNLKQAIAAHPKRPKCTGAGLQVI